MANDITITSVETVNGSNQIVSSFFTFTDELVLRVVFNLSSQLSSLPGLVAHITFTLINAQTNQSAASVTLHSQIPTGTSGWITWTDPPKSPDQWGLTDQSDAYGLRVIIVLDSEGTQLDAVAVSDIRWFRLKKQGSL
jgi:hypothetical protein